MFKTTMPTLKLLPVPIRLPFNWVDVMASGACLTGIGRGHEDSQNASNSSFVPNEDSKLIERPVVRPSSLSFASWLSVEAVSDSGQVLKSQPSSRGECFLHQLLADIVIHPFLEPTLPPRKPSHQATCRTSAFGLNVSPDPTESVANGLNLASVPGLPRGSCRYIAATKIHANYLGCLARWWSVYLNDKVDVVVTLLGFIQGCTSEILPSKQCNLIPADGQLKINSSTFEGYSHNLFSFYIPERPDIQADACWSELVNLFDGFSIVNHPSNGLANVISFQFRSFSHWLINLVVKLRGIPAVLTFGDFQYLVASISKSLQSFIDFWSILYRDYKLAFNRQGLIHASIIAHPIIRRLKSQLPFPPWAKASRFPRSRYA